MKKKLLAFSLATLVGVSGVIGGTYAYFGSTQTNNDNNFSAGTLSMSTYRDDIPIEGPMFYTHDSSAGAMGTGYWQPGDAHTRGLYIQNTGTLDGKFSKLYATPEAATGTQAYTDAMNFANQATVTIAMFEASGGEVDEWAWSSALKSADLTYKSLSSEFWADKANKDGKTVEQIKTEYLDWLALVEETFINAVFVEQNAEGQETKFTVKQVYTGSLSELVDPGSDVPTELQHAVKPGETMYLGYTIEMENLTPEANNPLQGKEVKFGFSHEFVQN